MRPKPPHTGPCAQRAHERTLSPACCFLHACTHLDTRACCAHSPHRSHCAQRCASGHQRVQSHPPPPPVLVLAPGPLSGCAHAAPAAAISIATLRIYQWGRLRECSRRGGKRRSWLGRWEGRAMGGRGSSRGQQCAGVCAEDVVCTRRCARGAQQTAGGGLGAHPSREEAAPCCRRAGFPVPAGREEPGAGGSFQLQGERRAGCRMQDAGGSSRWGRGVGGGTQEQSCWALAVGGSTAWMLLSTRTVSQGARSILGLPLSQPMAPGTARRAPRSCVPHTALLGERRWAPRGCSLRC